MSRYDNTDQNFASDSTIIYAKTLDANTSVYRMCICIIVADNKIKSGIFFFFNNIIYIFFYFSVKNIFQVYEKIFSRNFFFNFYLKFHRIIFFSNFKMAGPNLQQRLNAGSGLLGSATYMVFMLCKHNKLTKSTSSPLSISVPCNCSCCLR